MCDDGRPYRGSSGAGAELGHVDSASRLEAIVDRLVVGCAALGELAEGPLAKAEPPGSVRSAPASSVSTPRTPAPARSIMRLLKGWPKKVARPLPSGSVPDPTRCIERKLSWKISPFG